MIRLFAMLLCLLPVTGAEARVAVSMEQVFKRVPVIFSGTVTAVTETDAPVPGSYFTYEKKAMAVHFDIDHAWKGPAEKALTVYTWPKGAAPCTGVTIEIGKAYILWADMDASGKYILFDFCGGFTPGSPGLRAQLDGLFPSVPAPKKESSPEK